MNCPACGAANEDGVLFCERCKADLEMPASTARAPEPVLASEAPTVTLEPIPLEPIPLEPLSESTYSAPDPAAPTPEVPPVMESTVEQPAVVSKSPPPPVPASPPSTIEQPMSVTAPTTSGPIVNPKLVVVRGQKMDMQYPIYAGKNYIGRTDDKPVDIDLDDQEAPDRIWSSRQHAVIHFEEGALTIEDLSSLNGTFVNRTRVHPGQLKPLQENDVVQVGTVHMKVVLG
jgi:FHA domain